MIGVRVQRLALTAGGKRLHDDEARARAIAAEYGLPFVERQDKEPLEPHLLRFEGIFVWERTGLTLWSREGKVRWSEGVAHLRLERLDAGEGGDDHFLRHSELREGDALLDCTLGLAQDALVAARIVGSKGRVVGVEKSRALYVLTTEGLATHDVGPLSARIETVNADAAELLAAQPAKSFDVVSFDPMHERPGRSQPSFEGLRAWADYSELNAQMLEQARRVARRRVVVKGSRYSRDLKKLGLVAQPVARASSTVWAKLDPL